MRDFEYVEVGDELYSMELGKCVVEDTLGDNVIRCVSKKDNTMNLNYTKDGVLCGYENIGTRTLFWEKPDVILKERFMLERAMEECLVEVDFKYRENNFTLVYDEDCKKWRKGIDDYVRPLGVYFENEGLAEFANVLNNHKITPEEFRKAYAKATIPKE